MYLMCDVWNSDSTSVSNIHINLHYLLFDLNLNILKCFRRKRFCRLLLISHRRVHRFIQSLNSELHHFPKRIVFTIGLVILHSLNSKHTRITFYVSWKHTCAGTSQIVLTLVSRSTQAVFPSTVIDRLFLSLMSTHSSPNMSLHN